MATTEFGMKVRMELRNITNKQLADMLGISSAYLSDILRGRRDAFEQKKRIAKILEIKRRGEKLMNEIQQLFNLKRMKMEQLRKWS